MQSTNFIIKVEFSKTVRRVANYYCSLFIQFIIAPTHFQLRLVMLNRKMNSKKRMIWCFSLDFSCECNYEEAVQCYHRQVVGRIWPNGVMNFFLIGSMIFYYVGPS